MNRQRWRPSSGLLARDEKSAPVSDRRAFAKVRRTEHQYSRQLRQVARHVGEIIDGFPVGNLDVLPALTKALNDYAKLLEPWAQSVAGRMIADVSRRDSKAWEKYSADMGRALRLEIETAPTGLAMREMLAEQVVLITSLPVEAGQRVHDLTIEGLIGGGRAKEIAAEIMRSGEVTKSRANLIARTEVARTASSLTMARAAHVGSVAYVWRTSEDSDVRKEHRKLDGKVIQWDAPPIAGPKGQRYHAGMGPNCRCYPEPIVPEFKAEAA